MTATIEFTDYIAKNAVIDNLCRVPFHPKYLTHNYEEYTYPIQKNNTREMIQSLKKKLSNEGIYLIGRFAECEYYNMDAAICSAIDLSKIIN